MTWALAVHAFRECQRRPFPYLVVSTAVMLCAASQLLHAFSFGAGAAESANLAISAVFVAALANACFIGTALVRLDLERGTLGLILSQPVGIPAYVAGKFAGLVASSVAVCALTAVLASAALRLAGAPAAAFGAPLLLGWGRVLLAAAVLDAAALAVSAAANRAFAPLLLLGLFLAGDLAESSFLGKLLPNFGAFSFEAGRSPPWGWLSLYALLYCGAFLLGTYLLLSLRSRVKSGP